MKKILTILLSLCLLVSLATCLAAVSSSAEETNVTVGQVFEWNDQSRDTTGDPETETVWRKGKATSPDGNWKYHFYSLVKEMYQPLVVAAGPMYAWVKNPGPDDGGIGYARVRNFGSNFHPGEKADIVKTFICPSGGSIQISSTIARNNDLQAGSSLTGTSFAIYKENSEGRTLVYPEAGGGEYLTLVSTTPQTVDVTVDVAKNERIHIHIGAIGNQGSDAVDMANTITYKSISDDETDTVSNPTISVKTDVGTDYPTVTLKGEDSGSAGAPGGSDNGGLGVGAIVGIVAGGVAVVAIAVVVVIVLKKKKQN